MKAPRHPLAPALIIGTTTLSTLFGLLASQYALVAHVLDVSIWTALTQIPLSKLPRLWVIGTTFKTWLVVAASIASSFGLARRMA